MATANPLRHFMSRRRFVGRSIQLAIVSPVMQAQALGAIAQSPSLGPAERRTLRVAADVIIPALGRLPAAWVVGAHRYGVRIAEADPRIAALLFDGLRAIEAQSATTHGVRFDRMGTDPQVELLAALEKSDAPAGFFVALRDLVYEAYYTQPRIQRLLGYNFRSGRRRTAPVESFDEQHVARVRQMKPLYRQVTS
jgi:hypothetical protein